jgi:protein-S-isoprenylcysteine O-methyltransferase Ste14
VTPFIANVVFLLLTLSIGTVVLSIVRPDLRTWPRPDTTPWPRPLLALVGHLGQVGLVGSLLLGVLDYNSFVLGPWVRALGALLFAYGGFWGYWGARTLGMHRTMGNPGDLIDTGAYRHCRNPQYIGAITSFVGYALMCNSTLVLIASGFVAVHFILMPFAEEPWLRDGLGAPYEAYCERVPRFVPWFSTHGTMSGTQSR